MKKSGWITATVLCLLAGSGMAQNEVDALRYSQSTFGGTARTLGMGGAFGAMGGDMSSMYLNPAGIALYRKSEFSFTPAFHQFNSTSTFNGNTAFDGKSNVNFSNIGFVFTNHDEEKEFGWISTHFGFAYHRIDNFHRSLDAEGTNSQSSLLDTYLQQVNAGAGMTPEAMADQYPLGAYLAYYTYLIDTLPGDPTHYFSQVPFAGITQRRTLESRGTHAESILSFGANYNNRLYVGAALGFPRIRYSDKADYSETDHKDTIPGFSSFSQKQDLYTDGQGMNAKLGVIVRPHDVVRLGFSYQSPTLYSMNDEFFYTVEARYDSGFQPDTTVSGLFEYTLKTPMRATASLGIIIMKMGLLSLDYEWLDYGRAKLNSSVYAFNSENKRIADKHTSVANIRIGTEWRFDPYRVRLGYAYYGNPFDGGVNNDGSRESATAGFGIRGEGYYVDLAYVLTQSYPNLYYYDPALVDPVRQHLRSHIFAVTVGFRY